MNDKLCRLREMLAQREADVETLRAECEALRGAVGHTDECLEYAAKTSKAFCIASCAEKQRAALGEEMDMSNRDASTRWFHVIEDARDYLRVRLGSLDVRTSDCCCIVELADEVKTKDAEMLRLGKLVAEQRREIAALDEALEAMTNDWREARAKCKVLKARLRDCLVAMQAWGAEEDGIPDCSYMTVNPWATVQRARTALGEEDGDE